MSASDCAAFLTAVFTLGLLLLLPVLLLLLFLPLPLPLPLPALLPLPLPLEVEDRPLPEAGVTERWLGLRLRAAPRLVLAA